MSDPILDNLGEFLVKRVRDKAIGDWEKMVNGEMKGASAERLRRQIHSFNPDQKVALLILDGPGQSRNDARHFRNALYYTQKWGNIARDGLTWLGE